MRAQGVHETLMEYADPRFATRYLYVSVSDIDTCGFKDRTKSRGSAHANSVGGTEGIAHIAGAARSPARV